VDGKAFKRKLRRAEPSDETNQITSSRPANTNVSGDDEQTPFRRSNGFTSGINMTDSEILHATGTYKKKRSSKVSGGVLNFCLGSWKASNRDLI
jgi:hypothetical protein